ncbi:MAG TPA: hypothetical protein VFB21_21395 [Chthonomonadaceae bacterium]|nr:hypothetical protein [Chthonomonadaceae bacterium]
MENTRTTYANDVRPMRLDDLFADEPYLSPTMKARRLHEKLQEIQNAARRAEMLPEERTLYAPPLPDTPSAARVSLSQAALYLRAGLALRPDTPASLLRFREQTLRQWLDNTPLREAVGS